MADLNDPAAAALAEEPQATPKEPLDDDSFRAQVKTLIEAARDHMDDDVLPQVERATDYLNGKVDAAPANVMFTEDGTEVYEGSAVVIRECADRFRMMTPEIARVFLSSDEAVVFQPQTQEDEPKAEQATDYINWVWRVRNNGEDLLLDLVHDWGIKFCALKVYWCDQERTTTQQFDVTQAAAMALLQQAQRDPDVLSLEGEPHQVAVSVQTPEGVQTVPDVMVKGQIIKRERRGHIKIEAIPHDEFILDPDCRTSEEALLVGTDQWITVSDAVALGIEYDEAVRHATNLPSSGSTGAHMARRGHSDRLRTGNEDQSLDWVRVVQAVARIDRDQDGIAESYRIIALGDEYELYDAQLADDCVYIVGSPFRRPHEPIGMGIVEEMMDLQDVQTSLVRSSLDNYRRANHPRPVVGTQDADAYQDLMSWYSGVVRSKNPAEIGWYQVPFVGDKAFPYLEFFRQMGSMRTGIDPAGMGIDPDILKGMTVDGSKAVVTAPQTRMEYLIREFAVQIQRPLFRACLRLSVRYQDKPVVARLRNKWVEVDPSSWSAEMDCAVRVGLGTGTRQERLVGLLALMAKQEQLLATGSPLVTLAEYRNSLQELAELNGHKDTARYFKDLTDEELAAAAQQAAQAQQAQMQMAIEAEAAKARAVAEVKSQADLQAKQLDAEIQRQKIAADQETAQQQAVMDLTIHRDKAAQEREAAQQKAVMDMTIKREELALQERLGMQKLELEAQLKREELIMERELEEYRIRHQRPTGDGNIPEVVQ